MDALNNQRHIEALAQRWQAARMPEDMREMLHALARVFQEYHTIYTDLIDDYKRIVEGLTATCTRQTDTITRQTATVTRLTAAVEQLTAEPQTLAQAAADAYKAGFREYLAYTNDFLADNYEQWEIYRRAYDELVLDPDALSAIDPRPPDTALRHENGLPPPARPGKNRPKRCKASMPSICCSCWTRPAGSTRRSSKPQKAPSRRQGRGC